MRRTAALIFVLLAAIAGSGFQRGAQAQTLTLIAPSTGDILVVGADKPRAVWESESIPADCQLSIVFNPIDAPPNYPNYVVTPAPYSHPAYVGDGHFNLKTVPSLLPGPWQAWVWVSGGGDDCTPYINTLSIGGTFTVEQAIE